MKYCLLVVSLIGCGAGAVGPAGPAGPAGVAGKDGAGLALQTTTGCSHTDNTLNLNFYYRTTLFNDGARYVDCIIQGNSFGVSNSSFYTADVVGATSGGCQLFYDIDAASFGFWDFSLTSGPHAKYTDASSPNNAFVETFAASECK